MWQEVLGVKGYTSRFGVPKCRMRLPPSVTAAVVVRDESSPATAQQEELHVLRFIVYAWGFDV